jgi:hypothetical protein
VLAFVEAHAGESTLERREGVACVEAQRRCRDAEDVAQGVASPAARSAGLDLTEDAGQDGEADLGVQAAADKVVEIGPVEGLVGQAAQGDWVGLDGGNDGLVAVAELLDGGRGTLECAAMVACRRDLETEEEEGVEAVLGIGVLRRLSRRDGVCQVRRNNGW